MSYDSRPTSLTLVVDDESFHILGATAGRHPNLYDVSSGLEQGADPLVAAAKGRRLFPPAVLYNPVLAADLDKLLRLQPLVDVWLFEGEVVQGQDDALTCMTCYHPRMTDSVARWRV